MITVETGLPPGMEFDWQGEPRYLKSWYQVFSTTDPNDPWSYDEPRKVLFESDNLGLAHSYAYEAWLATGKTQIYTIIQPYDESCRGGYGFTEEE
jgi:hypothetical protein